MHHSLSTTTAYGNATLQPFNLSRMMTWPQSGANTILCLFIMKPSALPAWRFTVAVCCHWYPSIYLMGAPALDFNTQRYVVLLQFVMFSAFTSLLTADYTPALSTTPSSQKAFCLYLPNIYYIYVTAYTQRERGKEAQVNCVRNQNAFCATV